MSNKVKNGNLRRRANKLICHARSRAQKKKVSFDLEIGWVEDKLEYGLCEKTGIPFSFDSNGDGSRNVHTATLDRIDPGLGYIFSNVQVVIWGYNALKGEGTSQQALQIARALCECHDSKR